MNEEYDVIETARHAGNFRIFIQALEATGFTETLKDTGPYTIFAPVDDAFVKMPQSKLEGLFKIENRESLQSLLTHHIVPGKLLSRELKQLDETQTIKGEELRIESRAGLWINEAQVISPDLRAFNGVVHGIDTVLMHPTKVAAAS